MSLAAPYPLRGRCGACAFAALATIGLDVGVHRRPVSHDLIAHVICRMLMALIIEHILIWQETRRLREVWKAAKLVCLSGCVIVMNKLVFR